MELDSFNSWLGQVFHQATQVIPGLEVSPDYVGFHYWTLQYPREVADYPRECAIVRLHPMSEDETHVTIAGGGAHDCPLHPDMAWFILTSDDANWGGPFAGILNSGVTFGYRQMFTSNSLGCDNEAAALTLFRMIRECSRQARAIAVDVVPRFGGKYFDPLDVQASVDLNLASLSPPTMKTWSDHAGWEADPTGRHQWRYWNGSRWTTDVADDGLQSVDQLGVF